MEDTVTPPAGATNETTSSPKRLPSVAHAARMFYVLLAGLFAACIVLQVFFAGLAVLVSPDYWNLHRIFGHTIQYFTIAMLVAGLVGRLPWRTLALTALLFVLFAFQYLFLWVLPSLGLPAVRAFHAVNALALFWLAERLAKQVWRMNQSTRRALRRDPVATTAA